MKISIINDNKDEIEILIKSLSDFDEFELSWIALDSETAINQISQNKPDLLLLKLNLKFVDGAILTKILFDISNVAILLLSKFIDGNQSKIFEAMGNGALDVVESPYLSNNILVGRDELIKKIKILKKLIKFNDKENNKTKIQNLKINNNTKIVAIGSSTGGPKALASLFSKIPANTKAAFIIIQHVDAQFAFGLADWLQNYSNLPIHIAKSNTCPENGNIYIASTNDHLYLNEFAKFEYSSKPIELHFRPSIDIFFESLSKNWKNSGIAVLLTGMGYDGAKGLLELKNKGWHTIAQDEFSSVVYGMPKVAKELNAACEILPITQIALAILNKI